MAKSRLAVVSVLALAIGFVSGWEGLRTTAYRDVVGVPTVCFGETRGVHIGDKYTIDECKTMLGDGLREFEQSILKCISKPETIPDNSYVAFLSLSYNIGSSAFCRSTLVKKLNAGDIKGACHEILKWNRAGGRVIQGLTNRRVAEEKLCLSGL